MKNPEDYYDKEKLGENEYELYKDIHKVLKKHSEIWATEPKFVLLSAIEGLFEVYFPSVIEMQRALGLVDQEIQKNSKRPETR